MKKIVSLEEARSNKLTHYFTGKPCKNGGIGSRITSNKTCICDVCLSIRSEKLKLYRANNIKKLTNDKATWYRKNSERIIKKMKSERVRIETVRAIWREKNKARLAIYESSYNAKRKTEKSIYRKQNSAKYAAHCMNRRARKYQAIPPWFSEFDKLVEIESHHLAKARSLCTGFEWSVDHTIPMKSNKVCGLHCADNLQVIPAILNSIKGNRLIFTYPRAWLAWL